MNRPAPRVLLVEDNDDSAEMLARRLRRCGYEVLIARDGRSAVEMTRQQRPALVLMDISLPVLDGWAATAELKRDPTTRAIPIVALTAHSMPGDRERMLAAGCDDYHTKPVDLPGLLAQMAVWAPV